VKISPGLLFHKMTAALLALVAPFGAWGLGALAIVDTSSIPVPIDAMLITYVALDHRKFLIYCAMAAVGSGIGSFVPYYFGRVGGELFLLKRINRQRYEKLRDRFERQEFLAIMVPAMMPPPMPVKVIEFAAGVFEMKPLWFFSAICAGKFVRFLVEALITIFYGPAILDGLTRAIHHHAEYVWAIVAVLLGLVLVYVIRKLFSRRRGTRFPVEDEIAE
jgi:membrane protein YqaA with SNARE-associated domain